MGLAGHNCNSRCGNVSCPSNKIYVVALRMWDGSNYTQVLCLECKIQAKKQKLLYQCTVYSTGCLNLKWTWLYEFIWRPAIGKFLYLYFIKIRTTRNLSLWLYEYFWIISLHGHLAYFILKVLAWEICNVKWRLAKKVIISHKDRICMVRIFMDQTLGYLDCLKITQNLKSP